MIISGLGCRGSCLILRNASLWRHFLGVNKYSHSDKASLFRGPGAGRIVEEVRAGVMTPRVDLV